MNTMQNNHPVKMNSVDSLKLQELVEDTVEPVSEISPVKFCAQTHLAAFVLLNMKLWLLKALKTFSSGLADKPEADGEN